MDKTQHVYINDIINDEGKYNLIDLPKYTNYIFEHLLQNKFKAYKWKWIHFVLTCGKLLHTWNILRSDKCYYCKEIDDYDHHFIKCKLLLELNTSI